MCFNDDMLCVLVQPKGSASVGDKRKQSTTITEEEQGKTYLCTKVNSKCEIILKNAHSVCLYCSPGK